MYRSYFFALLACAFFSAGALINAYSNLPQPENSLSPMGCPGVGTQATETPVVDTPPAESQTVGARPAGTQDTEAPLGASHPGDAPPAGTQATETPVMDAPPVETHPMAGSRTLEPALGAGAGLIEPAAAKTPSANLMQIAAGNRKGYRNDSATPLNAQTDNFNILILGTDGDKLEMVCVYSINHHLIEELKSVSLFFPVDSLVIYKGRKNTLAHLYRKGDWQAVASAVEKTMHINFNNYVKIDRQALRDLEKYFEPIYVDGVKVEMETLFVRRTSHNDDRVIARILRQVLRPKLFFKYIPGLVFGINGGLESDFSFSPRNLADYYSIGKRLSTKKIEKIVLTGTTEWHRGRKVNIPPEETMENAIYRTTQ